MKATVKDVRKAVQEIIEGKVSASPEFMKKEHVREKVQGIVQELVKAGKVEDQEQLAELFGVLEMSVDALRMIPLDVWHGLSKK